MAQHKYTSYNAIAVVIANMVGTGVFTSLGYQLLDIQSSFVILLLWLTGGITALCGALTYAELASRMPRSGGEYHFLSRLYHPGAGFVSGWVSLTVGFAAPTALAAMTMAAYLDSSIGHLLPFNRQLLAALLVAGLTLVHSSSHSASGHLQNGFTLLKVLLIVVFVVAVSAAVANPQPVNFLPVSGDGALVASGAFAVSLIYVNYAYTGWNAATYLSGEIENPQRSLPLVLIAGTAIVVVLYLALNATFLRAVPVEALQGKIEVGVVVAEHSFGPTGALVMGGTLSLLLVSTISAMLMAGPRVLQVMGEDFRLFRLLASKNSNGVPRTAVVVQGTLAILFIVTSTFESVLVFSGFILGLSSLATVLGIFILRARDHGQTDDRGEESSHIGYRTWLYPLPPLIYAALMIWTLGFITLTRPAEAAVAAIVIVLGIVGYLLSERFSRQS